MTCRIAFATIFGAALVGVVSFEARADIPYLPVNLLSEPGFEMGGVSWTFTGNSGLTQCFDTCAFVNAPTHGASGTISQTVNVVPGRTYMVVFTLYSNAQAAGHISASFGGSERSWDDWRNYLAHVSFPATPTDASATFEFHGENLDGTYFIDNVGIFDACGNGTTDPGEECDYRDKDYEDRCSSDCVLQCEGKVYRTSELFSYGGLDVCDPDQNVNALKCPEDRIGDINSDGEIDCRVAELRDRKGHSLEVWCGRFNPREDNEAAYLIGVINGDEKRKWGNCVFPSACNRVSAVVQGRDGGKGSGEVDCLLSAHWLNEEKVADANGITCQGGDILVGDSDDDGKRDQRIINYFLTRPDDVEINYFERNSPPVLVSSQILSVESLPPPGDAVGQPGDVMTIVRNWPVCSLDADLGCDDADQAIFDASEGLCLGDADFEFLADGDGNGCVDAGDRGILGLDFVNVPVEATKLIVVDKTASAGKAKTVFVSKDPAINKGTGLDPSNIHALVEFGYGGLRGVFEMPTGALGGWTGWVANKDAVAKFINKKAPVGPTQAKVAVIKPGKLLKLVGMGLGDTPADLLSEGSPIEPVRVMYEVQNGAEWVRHCTSFASASCAYKRIAGDTGAKLVCKQGMPTSCPPLGSPSGAFVDRGNAACPSC